jgi:TonB family protein
LTELLQPGREREVLLALVLSAGLHLLALLTLDLSPGDWRHGVGPALKVTLVPAPLQATAGPLVEKAVEKPVAKQPEKPLEKSAGIEAREARSGSSLPMPARYYKSSEVDTPATPLERGPLVFPEHAYVSKLRGTVKARIYIDEDGRVVSVDIVNVKPFGGIFEEAALEALRQVRYSPALLAGQTVKTQKLIEVVFDPYEEARQ